MRTASVYLSEQKAGSLEELERGHRYRYTYEQGYQGRPISLGLPVTSTAYEFSSFPPFFDGLLPEGILLEALLRERKIDRDDPFSQLVAVGQDTVGAVTVVEDRLPAVDGGRA